MSGDIAIDTSKSSFERRTPERGREDEGSPETRTSVAEGAQPSADFPEDNASPTRSEDVGGRRAVTSEPFDEKRVKLGDYVQRSKEVAAAKGGSPERTTWEKVGTLLSIVLVLSLCGAVVLFLRRLQPTARDREGNRVLEVLGRVPVSSKQQVSLVRVGSRVLCVGISPDGIRCLSEITDPVEVARLLPGDFERALDVESRALGENEVESGLSESEIDRRTAPFRNELSRLRQVVSGWRDGTRRASGGAS
ncbi:MAG: flagellar biosynthetic protein FliO [Planctomycetes bacterium]|nr:flagellar biosynthetic protein FliO [Planctomycetota bacterium]